MLLLSLDMIRAYGQAYENAVKEFKMKYFEDRSKVILKYQFQSAIHIKETDFHFGNTRFKTLLNLSLLSSTIAYILWIWLIKRKTSIGNPPLVTFRLHQNLRLF